MSGTAQSPVLSMPATTPIARASSVFQGRGHQSGSSQARHTRRNSTVFTGVRVPS